MSEEYLKMFDQVADQSSALKAQLDLLDKQQDQDGRLFAALEYIKGQQKLNDLLYDLVVEMHNNLSK